MEEAPVCTNHGSENDDGDGDEEEGNEEEIDFESTFFSFSKEWLNTQLTHRVSLTASNCFWKLALKYIPKIHELKTAENIKKKIPQYLQVKKNLYQDHCPEIRMSFVFLNKADGSIIKVQDDHTPLNQFLRNSQYQLLYEEAHIEVRKFSRHLLRLL